MGAYGDRQQAPPWCFQDVGAQPSEGCQSCHPTGIGWGRPGGILCMGLTMGAATAPQLWNGHTIVSSPLRGEGMAFRNKFPCGTHSRYSEAPSPPSWEKYCHAGAETGTVIMTASCPVPQVSGFGHLQEPSISTPMSHAHMHHTHTHTHTCTHTHGAYTPP